MVGLDLMGLSSHVESKTDLRFSIVEIQELSLECDMVDYSAYMLLSAAVSLPATNSLPHLKR